MCQAIILMYTFVTLKNTMIGTNSFVETSFTSYFILYQVPYVLGKVAFWDGQLLNLFHLWPVHWINIPISKHVISDDTNEKSEKKKTVSSIILQHLSHSANATNFHTTSHHKYIASHFSSCLWAGEHILCTPSLCSTKMTFSLSARN